MFLLNRDRAVSVALMALAALVLVAAVLLVLELVDFGRDCPTERRTVDRDGNPICS